MASEQNVRPVPQRQPSRLEKIFHKSSTISTAPQNPSTTPPKVTPPPSIHVSPVTETTNGDSMTVSGPAPASAIPNATRNTIGRQLERMFSRSGKSKESGKDHHNNSSEHTSDTDNTSLDSNNPDSKISGISDDRKSSNIDKPTFIDRKVSQVESLRPPGTIDRKPSAADSLKPALSDRKGSSLSSQNSQQPCGRFRLSDDGSHEHFLKSAKRQEKLSGLLRDMMGGKKREDQVDGDGLGLVSSWIDQLKADKDKLVQDKKSGPAHSATLVEKYGKCQEVVGRGAFGVVRISHKVDPKNENREQLYAVKEFRRRPQETPKKYTKRLTSEFCISSSLRHPNVIHTLDLIQDAKGEYCEVMEYCAGGDLYSLVLAAGKLEVMEADCYFKQLMRGVEYMHEMGVAHRDLKPENLLLTCHGSLKITDFGNGECFRMAWEKEAHKTSGLCGSAPYISPEEYTEKDFDPRAVDVWATGVIYMAMRTGRHLWRVARRDEDEFFDKYLEGRKDEGGYGPIEGLHRARCRNVIYSILDPNPTRRITASQVLKSEWGREIHVCSAGDEGY